MGGTWLRLRGAGLGASTALLPQAGRFAESMMAVALCLLSMLGGYLLTSALLLKCLGLLHQPKRQHFRCCHISHRGIKDHLL